MSRGTYGAPRVLKGLRLGRHVRCDRKRVSGELALLDRAASRHPDAGQIVCRSRGIAGVAGSGGPDRGRCVRGWTRGIAFAGIIGSLMGQRSVDGVTPATFTIPNDRALGVYTAVIQKQQSTGTLAISVACPVGIRSGSTSADYGVVSVTCGPREIRRDPTAECWTSGSSVSQARNAADSCCSKVASLWYQSEGVPLVI